jgi:hypothetical protein
MTAFAFAAPVAGTGVVAKATASYIAETAAATVAPAAMPTASIDVASDDTELLALGARLMPTFREFAEAAGRKAEIMKAVAERCPLPEALVVDRKCIAGPILQYAEDETDLDGEVVYPPEIVDEETGRVIDPKPARRILTTAGLKDYLAHWAPARRADTPYCNRMAIARRYEAAKAKAVKDLGWDEVTDEWEGALYRLEAVLHDIWHAEAHTFAGIVVQAEAIALAQGLPKRSCILGWARRGDSIAAAVLRLQRRIVA